jgi:hypothetical protein
MPFQAALRDLGRELAGALITQLGGLKASEISVHDGQRSSCSRVYVEVPADRRFTSFT